MAHNLAREGLTAIAVALLASSCGGTSRPRSTQVRTHASSSTTPPMSAATTTMHPAYALPGGGFTVSVLPADFSAFGTAQRRSAGPDPTVEAHGQSGAGRLHLRGGGRQLDRVDRANLVAWHVPALYHVRPEELVGELLDRSGERDRQRQHRGGEQRPSPAPTLRRLNRWWRQTVRSSRCCTLDFQSFVTESTPQRINVSIIRGAPAANVLDPNAYAESSRKIHGKPTRIGDRPTNERQLGWVVDASTVAFVTGYQVTDDALFAFAENVEVQP